MKEAKSDVEVLDWVREVEVATGVVEAAEVSGRGFVKARAEPGVAPSSLKLTRGSQSSPTTSTWSAFFRLGVSH